MKTLTQIEVGNTVNLPKREQLNIFAHDGEGILNRIRNECNYNEWGTLESSTAIRAIGTYISDVNLNTEDRIYRNIEKYIDAKLTNALESMRDWIVEDFSRTVQDWIENEFAPDLIENIKERMQSENFNVDEDIKSALKDCVNKYR